MRYTPVELRHVRPGRAIFGYKRREVDHLIEDVAGSFEDVWAERGELSDQVEELEKALGELKARESLLAITLVSAEKAAAEAKDAAHREAELIISEAHQEARSITRTALGERERLFAEARRIEIMLRSALGMVDGGARPEPLVEEPGEGAAPIVEEPRVDPWPNREDTREFEAIELLGEPEGVRRASGADPDPRPEPELEPHVSFDVESFDSDVYEPAPEPAPAALPPPLPGVEDEDDGPWSNRDLAWG